MTGSKSEMRSHWRRRGLLFAGLVLAWFMVAVLRYRDTNCTFLRAESGWYQAVAHDSSAGRNAAMRDFFLHSHHGHYMPFAVWAEIEITRLFGMRPDAWKYRAIIWVAFLGSVLSGFTYRAARRMGSSGVTAAAFSFALTSLILLHPQMREFIAFPTLIYQLTWMLLFVVTLRSLVAAAAHPEQRRWVWIAAACAYASMHVIGLGAITAIATAAVLGLTVLSIAFGKLPRFLPYRWHWTWALFFLLLLSGLHLAAMQLLQASSETRSLGQPLHLSTMLSLSNALLIRIVECFAGTSSLRQFSLATFDSAWPFGLLAMTIGFILWLVTLRVTLAEPTTSRVIRCFLYSFSFFAFIAFLVLVAARVPFESQAYWFRAYLFNPRYVVPATLLLLPSAVAFLPGISERHRYAFVFCCLLFGVVAFVGNDNRKDDQSFRTAQLSHKKTWKAIVGMARECRAAQLAVPDVPTIALGEFPWHLQDYDSLLRYSLGLPADAKIDYAPWEHFDTATRSRYESAVPSYLLVAHALRLSVPDPGATLDSPR